MTSFCALLGRSSLLLLGLLFVVGSTAEAGKTTRTDRDKAREILNKNEPLPDIPRTTLTQRNDAVGDGGAENAASNSEEMSIATPIEHGRLKNGMQVIFVADRRTPSVVAQVWYRVGSADERPGITGISHFLEHMMFWQIEKKERNLYKNRIESLGGKYNAFTSYDFTAYYANVANVFLPQVIELEAKRMRKLKFATEQFEKERQVVLEERQLRVDNRPSGALREQMLITAFERSGLRNPIIGWQSDIESLSAEQLYAWHYRWYQPSNATLIVIGNSDLATIMDLAKRHFGRFDNNDDDEPQPLPRLSEPLPSSYKRVSHYAPGSDESIKLLWHIPSFDRDQAGDAADIDDLHMASVSLDMLSTFLGQDKSSWLYHRLVRERKLALTIAVRTHNALRQRGMFWIEARPRSGVSLEKLEDAIIEELEKLNIDSIRDIDVTRARTDLIVESTYLRDSPFYQAYVIGQLISSGAGWELLDTYAPLVTQVEAEDMIEVLDKYLRGKAYVAGYLIPGQTEKSASAADTN